MTARGPVVPRFSVIVPVAVDPRLSRCLEGLSAQAVGAGTYEILVVDDGGSDDTRRTVERFPAVYLVQEKEGPYAARNRGIAAARGDILVFTDSDCFHSPDWLSIVGSVFEREACDVAVGPSYALNDDPVGLLVQAVDEARWARLAGERWVSYCDTRNLAGWRSAFLEEPFDPAFQHGGDLEWGIRARKRGYRILYVPQMAVRHENVSSLRQVWRRGIRRGRGVARVRQKHGADARISGARSLVILGADLKERLLAMATRPSVRPIASAGLIAATASLSAAVALLLGVFGPRRLTARAFEGLDRVSLLLGLVLGP